MEVAVIGLHKRFCDELFFEQVFHHVTCGDFVASDSVVLLTCNRIEIYVASPRLAERHPELLEELKIPFSENIEKRFYTFMGQDALNHLAQVASGLDSLICGESDIQHQVKKAYQIYGQHLNSEGHFLFQKGLHIAKKLRQEFDIKPLKSLVEQVYSHLDPLISKGDKILFVGQSQLNCRLLGMLSSKIKPVLVSSRAPVNGSVWSYVPWVSYDELDKLEPMDGVIAATKGKRLYHLRLTSKAWMCDLSRPRVLMHTHDPFFDLSFFEHNYSKMALEQRTARLEALEYINMNVKRLMERRAQKLTTLSVLEQSACS
jgi:glutamyl-tRNA reductase